MNRMHRIATAIFASLLVTLLVAPLAAPVCVMGLCDVSVACRTAMQPTEVEDSLKSIEPSCCTSLSASIAEPDVATRDGLWSGGPAAPTPLAIISMPAPPPSPPIARASVPPRSGRTTLNLHRTLLL